MSSLYTLQAQSSYEDNPDLAEVLRKAADHITQSQLLLSQSSLTAKVYASTFQAFYVWARETNHPVPTKARAEIYRTLEWLTNLYIE